MSFYWGLWLLHFITILYLSTCQDDVKVLSIKRLRYDPTIQLFTERGLHNDTIIITLVGPDDRWFGIGIGNKTMDGCYAFVVYEDGTLTERRLGNHNSGMQLLYVPHINRKNATI